jgi:VWFA-related protein
MTRSRSLLIGLFAILLSVIATFAQDGRQQHMLGIDVGSVTLDVVVIDQRGSPVAGLQKDDFKAYEGDVQQTITTFVPAEAPVTVAILAEFRYIAGWDWHDIVKPAARFIQSLREDDWGALVFYDIHPETLVDFTKDKRVLLQGLQELRTPVYRAASLYDAMCSTLDRLESISGKKAILLLSTGLDTVSKHNYSKTMRKAELSNTVIYTINLGSDNPPLADRTMRFFARQTGGAAFIEDIHGKYWGIHHEPEKSLDEAVENVGEYLKHQYSISFVPKNLKKDGKLHKLRVEVIDRDLSNNGKPDTLSVRHKEGYYAPKS